MISDGEVDSSPQHTQQWVGDWGPTGPMPAPLFWVRFHSIRQYSVPCSAPQDGPLWRGEWRSAGASPLPLIRALCSSAPWGVKVKAPKKKKRKGKKKGMSLCVASTSHFHCGFPDMKRCSLPVDGCQSGCTVATAEEQTLERGISFSLPQGFCYKVAVFFFF